MKNSLRQSNSYTKFVDNFPKSQITLSTNSVWSYYSLKAINLTNEIIIFLGSIYDSGASFYQQLNYFNSKSYTAIAIDDYELASISHIDFINEFNELLENLVNNKRVHLCGIEYSGFLIQLFTERYPERVESLILCNSYINSSWFNEYQKDKYLKMYYYMPKFVMRNILRKEISGLKNTYRNVYDFLMENVNEFSTSKIASRLNLKCKSANVIGLEISDIMVLEPNELSKKLLQTNYMPKHMTNQILNYYPKNTHAFMKTGDSNFPHLSHPEDFNLYVEVFIRRFHLYGINDNNNDNNNGPKIMKEEEAEKYFNIINDSLKEKNSSFQEEYNSTFNKSNNSSINELSFNDEEDFYEEEVSDTYFDNLLEITKSADINL